ncbi:MAG: hypothetical protein Q8Q52_07275 [Acidimicrobiia bacterium]|nr:hypothetical protein [Acidimicrobiia bacterium]
MRVSTIVAITVVGSSCFPTARAPVTLEEWCATQAADRCVEAVVLLHDAPSQESCVLASLPDRPLFDQCGPIPNPNNTATTVPPPGADPADSQSRLFIEEDLPMLDAHIVEVLAAAGPPGDVTVGIVLAQPMSVSDMEDFVANLGGTWVSAWRTDLVCFLGPGGDPRPDRFAYRDGVERAAAARRAADQGDAPATGHMFLEEVWDRMEQAARAMREPGVTVEAIEVALPVEALAKLEDQAFVKTVRIALNPDEAGDLSEPAPIDCPPSP